MDDQLSEAGKHDQQADATDTEIPGDCPKEDEQSDADKDVVDAFAADICRRRFFEEVLR